MMAAFALTLDSSATPAGAGGGDYLSHKLKVALRVQ